MNIENKYQDLKYTSIVSDILYHPEFTKTKNISHHGLNRYEHCVRVSYYSYKTAKILHLDYEKTARAGLLHDFFLETKENKKKKDKFQILINHPKKALATSKKYFDITPIEEDIILSHMFPIGLRTPKYLESWIVTIVDDIMAIYEEIFIKSKQLKHAYNFLLIFLINYLR